MELHVPDAAWDELRLEIREDHGIHGAECVRAIAAPVVAAELRRLADEADAHRDVTGAMRYRDGYFDGANMVRDRLTDRADELDSTREEKAG